MEPGNLLGNRYRLDERVDGGGMGDVWRGRDTRLDRTVAIKVLHSGLAGDTTFRQRFHGEARAVAALQAPGVVNLFDYGEDSPSDSPVVSYLVMEFVPGRSLRTILSDRGSLPADEVLNIVAQSAEALDAAHRAGIVHRDVKPGNILIKPDTGQVKIVDFGIARTRGESSLTETGTIMGSVSYVSPEQLYGRELTGSSDVYSLGVVAYECLAGQKPFPGDVPATIINEQLHKAPPPLPQSVPAALAAVIMRALAKDPAQRWNSAAAFAVACRELQTTGPINTAAIDPDATTVVNAAESNALTTALNTADNAETTRLAARSPAPEPTPVGAAPPNGVEPQAADDPSHRRRTGRTRAFVLTAVIVALIAVGGAAAARPWAGTDAGAQTPARDGGSEDETSADINDDEDTTSASPTESTSVELTPSESGSQSASSSPSATPSDDEPSTDEPTGTVPDLYGMSESEAIGALEGQGFGNYYVYSVGQGDIACSVVEQDPPGGTDAELDDEIGVGVQYVVDSTECGEITTSTPSP